MSLRQIRKHIPNGQKEPALLEKFVRAKPGRIQWDSLDGLKKSVRQTAVPFLRLYDGGILALWYHAAEPAVVQIGSEGESEVIATTFADFVAAVNAGKCGLSDFDDREDKFVVPGVNAKALKKSAGLQKKFDAWFDEQHEKPVVDGDSQALLKRVCEIVEQMERDNFVVTYIYTKLYVEVQATGVVVRVRGRKALKVVPKKYNLVPEIDALIRLCKHPKLKEYSVNVWDDFISIDKNKELILMTPVALARTNAAKADEQRRRRKR